MSPRVHLGQIDIKRGIKQRDRERRKNRKEREMCSRLQGLLDFNFSQSAKQTFPSAPPPVPYGDRGGP